jgi:hypothetical protein
MRGFSKDTEVVLVEIPKNSCGSKKLGKLKLALLYIFRVVSKYNYG